MDAEQRLAFERLVHDALAPDLDELYRRVEAIERRLAGRRDFSREALDRERRQAILWLRARGLSIAAIAAATECGRTRVAEVVEGVPAPPRVLGMDGKRHPARHGWGPHSNGVPSSA